MSKYLWLLDNGHGGIIAGIPQTAGKRSPEYGGKILYEGEFNRAIVNRLIERLQESNIDYINLVPELTDVPLKERVNRANKIDSEENRDCILISTHSNAGGGTGFEIFTSKGETGADLYPDFFTDAFRREFPTESARVDMSDGDTDKEENFYILKNTTMPALLTENFFMDNKYECPLYLMTSFGRSKIAKYHFNAIMEIENGTV